VVISVALAGCNGSDNGGLIPLPELSGVEPLVRERILQRRQAVVETPSAETWLPTNTARKPSRPTSRQRPT
jgi:hypothetical protein